MQECPSCDGRWRPGTPDFWFSGQGPTGHKCLKREAANKDSKKLMNANFHSVFLVVITKQGAKPGIHFSIAMARQWWTYGRILKAGAPKLLIFGSRSPGHNCCPETCRDGEDMDSMRQCPDIRDSTGLSDHERLQIMQPLAKKPGIGGCGGQGPRGCPWPKMLSKTSSLQPN